MASNFTTISEALAAARALADANPRRAQEICIQILRQAPRTVAAMELIGEIEATAGNVEAAEMCFRRILEHPENRLKTQLRLAELFIRHGQIDRGLKQLSEISDHLMEGESLSGIGQSRGWSAPIQLRAHDLGLAIPSFSLTGEDMFLRRRFKRKIIAKQPGFYVDIGCNAPIEASNTYLFYCHGWRGICIDPLPKLSKPYAQSRPRDIFINAAITELDGEAEFERRTQWSGMSRIYNGDASALLSDSTVEIIPTRRLDDILAEHVPPDTLIDFFSIDVEGYELGVLRSNDWQKYRPAWIVMEGDSDTEAAQYLAAQGYQVRAVASPNVYFIDQLRAANQDVDWDK